MTLTAKLMQSFAKKDHGIYTNQALLDWVRNRNDQVAVSIKKIPFEPDGFWYYDEQTGQIQNRNQSFFSITGLQTFVGDQLIAEQPVLLQPEIGYLGILCKEIDGMLYFLMQAKIEPGNLNKIQISPTIQATKSNFTQKHGGAKPPYLEYFTHAERHTVLVDQIQSEQSSRFYHKRNRNLVLLVEEDIELLPSHRFMTLGQIKALMHYDNLVNMDTRTVLSCLPLCEETVPYEELTQIRSYFSDDSFYRSIFEADENKLPLVYQYCNNHKMFSEQTTRFCPLHQLDSWEMTPTELVCKKQAPFKVIYCDIAIEGREVKEWKQPLFEAVGQAFFGLMCGEMDGKLHFLVHAQPEVGCFDSIELAPTIQLEAGEVPSDVIEQHFFTQYQEKADILHDVMLSEEGGRFYHEQNRNVVLTVNPDTIKLPDGYFWLTYRTLNRLVQVNNTLNIQLRNLLSLLEVSYD